MSLAYDASNPRFPDVSHYRPIDPVPFLAAKPVALGAKATEGGYTDPTFAKNAVLAAGGDFPLIAYDFAHGGDASHFLAVVKPKSKGIIPCLDAEAGDLTMAEAETWVKAVAFAWGRLPWLYGHSLLNTWNPAPTSVLRQCLAWQPTYGMSLNPTSWVKRVAVWQYSDGQTKWSSPGPRSFPGIGACDMNTSYLSEADLRAAAGLDQGEDMTEAEVNALICAALTTATIGDAQVQAHRNKAVSDVLLGLPKRKGQGDAYDQAFDEATKALAASNGGLTDHKHDLPGFPTGTGSVTA